MMQLRMFKKMIKKEEQKNGIPEMYKKFWEKNNLSNQGFLLKFLIANNSSVSI